MSEPHPTNPPRPEAVDQATHCTLCRSPLRPAQRYCTACGERRAGVHLPFLQESPGLPPAAPPAPAHAVLPPAGAAPRGPRTWPVGPIAVVLGALAIGLVVGRWAATDDPVPVPAAAAQEIRVVSGLGGAATGPAGVAAAPADAADAKEATTKKDDAKAEKDPSADVTGKLDKKAIDDVLNDASGNENLAPKDSDPNGANFDEIK